MAALRMIECLRKKKGKLMPTLRNPRDGMVIHQMDHLFITDSLAPRLVSCNIGNPERVFGESLSDHLPIVADFVCH